MGTDYGGNSFWLANMFGYSWIWELMR